jgi:hypothetical protein
MEAIPSSETSFHTRYTRRHIPEDGILHYEQWFRWDNLEIRHPKIYLLLIALWVCKRWEYDSAWKRSLLETKIPVQIAQDTRQVYDCITCKFEGARLTFSVYSKQFWQWCINTQNYWGFGFRRPVFQKPENETFWKLDLFPSSGKRGRTEPGIYPSFPHEMQIPLHLRTETHPVSETLCYLFFRIPSVGLSPPPPKQ